MRTAAPRGGLVSRVWETVCRYQWLFIGAAMLGTFAAACYGISLYEWPGAQSPDLEPPDIAYLALQLFIWQSGGVFLGPKSLYLEIARFAAPALLGWTALQALRLLFLDQYHLLRARLRRNHVIICGLGTRGLALAEGFQASGDKVVIVEHRGDNASVRSARAHGYVVIGDATTRRTLIGAGIRKARHLVTVCGDDAVNAAVVASASSWVKPNSDRILNCHVHIADPLLWERLKPREIASPDERRVRVQFFNPVDTMANTVAAAVLVDPAAAPVHLLIVGVNEMTERVLLHVALRWPLIRRPGDERLRVTLVDRDASRNAVQILERDRRLRERCDILVHDMPNDAEESAWATLFKGGQRFSAGCVALADDHRAATLALAVLDHSRNQAFPIALCARQERGLQLLLDGVEGVPHRHRLSVFGVLERGCTSDLILNAANETLARAIHDEYCREQERAGHTPVSNPALRRWDALPDGLKESNRRQADHVHVKLAEICCGVAPLTDWDATPVRFTHEEVEKMARLEHQRWMDERFAARWRLGEKNIQAKRSPYLVPWEALDERVKEFDRNTVSKLPVFLARVGLHVYRRSAVPAAEPVSV